MGRRGLLFLICLLLLTGCHDGYWQHQQSVSALSADTVHPGCETVEEDVSLPDTITMSFVGDVMLSSEYYAGTYMTFNPFAKTVEPRYFFEKMLSVFSADDWTVANCENVFTDQIQEMAEKNYTPAYWYASGTENAGILPAGSVEVVSLANNHIYDYGEEAFFSTLTALDDHNVYRIGAGKDLDEAREVQYFTINGRKIAYVAATRAEKTILTPGAKENSPGVFRAYDTALLKETIRDAKSQSDIVILYIHWGAEHENRIEDIIRTQGKEYIDSGADVIIGAHAHQLQGIEIYKGKMIAYNLGNYLFNGWTTDTGLIEVCIDEDGNIENYFHPFIQKGTFLSKADETDSERILDYMESISVNVTFDEKGRVMERA